MTKDEGITRLRGLSEMIVEYGTHILVMPSSKGVTQHKRIAKKKIYKIYSHDTPKQNQIKW
jgi:hypothetical protein